jgi:hypothetical protein
MSLIFHEKEGGNPEIRHVTSLAHCFSRKLGVICLHLPGEWIMSGDWPRNPMEILIG